jgi:hypothetical protein
MSARSEVSGKSLHWKPCHIGKSTRFSRWSALNYRPFSIKGALFPARILGVWGMKFQGNSSKGSRDTGEMSLVFQVKYPYILTDCNQTYALCSVCMESMKFQENPSNLSRNTAEKVLCSESSVLNYWTIAPKLASFVAHGWRIRYMSRAIPPIEVELQERIK